MTRRGILTGGTWCVDRNKLVDHWPSEDGLAEILDEESNGGGSACNLAVDIKKLDPAMPVATIGLVSDDSDGRLLLAEADRYGIDRRQMTVVETARTHYTDAFASASTGKRTHITNLGVSRQLSPDHFDLSASDHRFFHLGIVGVHELMDGPWEDEPSGWVAVLKSAKAAGLETNIELASADPAKLAMATKPCLPFLDLLTVNDSEIGAIADVPTVNDGKTDPGACIHAAKIVLDQSTAKLIAVHFPDGAIVVTRDGKAMTRPSVDVPDDVIVGANGAGDAFAAGFLYALHEGWGHRRRSYARPCSSSHFTSADVNQRCG